MYLIKLLRLIFKQSYIILWPVILFIILIIDNLGECSPFSLKNTTINQLVNRFKSSKVNLNSNHNYPDVYNDTERRLEYFDQLNARNHRPIITDSGIDGAESQSRVLFSSPDSAKTSTTAAAAATDNTTTTQPNPVYYFSPKSFGTTSYGNNKNVWSTSDLTASAASATTTIRPTIDAQQSSYIYMYPQTAQPSSDSMINHLGIGNLDNGNDQIGKLVKYYSIKSMNDTNIDSDNNRPLLQKYYNRDLSAMTAILNKHHHHHHHHRHDHSSKSSHNTDGSKLLYNEDDSSSFDEDHDDDQDDEVENANDNDNVDGGEDDHDDDHGNSGVVDGGDGVHRQTPQSVVAYYRSSNHVNGKNNKQTATAATATTLTTTTVDDNFRTIPKVGGRSVYRLHHSTTPRLLRRYYHSGGRTTLPVHRLQTSHSHTMPHYYIPHHTPFETIGSHHHINLPEKSGTWLGSGLAAGILIGAIPFGIMMASMMPTLFTGAMPIVNTAAVGKRRRRRRSTLFESRASPPNQQQRMTDKLARFIRRGIIEMIDILDDNDYMANKKNSYHHLSQYNGKESTVPPPPSSSSSSTPRSNINDNNDNSHNNQILKIMAKYAMAAMDEPKCLKEMLCIMVAEGRHRKTTPLQKTLYILIKWLPKDLGRTFGLDGLFNAVRNNACHTAYRCPIPSIHLMKNSIVDTDGYNNDLNQNEHQRLSMF